MKKSKGKFQPVPLKLQFVIPNGTNTNYIDISQCISKVTRKFLRQGLVWALAGGRIIMPPSAFPTGNAVYLSTLQHSWMVSNSWEKTFRAWDKQQKEAIAASGSQSSVAKYRDFKIYADKEHADAGSSSNLAPIQLGPGPNSPSGPYTNAIVVSQPVNDAEEWRYSQIVVPAQGVNPEEEFYLQMHGTDRVAATGDNTKALIVGYANSRAQPHNPDPVSTSVAESFLNDMFDYGDVNTEITINAQFNNDELPYDQLAYPGGAANFSNMENQVMVYGSNTIGVQSHTFTGFTAPCGLIRVDQIGSDDAGLTPNMILELELIPGHHRGYLAQPMMDM